MRAPLVLVLSLLLAGCAAEAPEPAAPPEQNGPLPPDCDPPCKVLIHDHSAGNAKGAGARAWEPTAAVNPQDPLHIAVASYELSDAAVSERPAWPRIFVSRDGGATWTSAPFPGGIGTTGPFETHGGMGDPVLRFLRDGTLAFSALTQTETQLGITGTRALTGYSVIFARSTDGGDTWEPPVTVAQGQGASAAGLPELGGAAFLWRANDKQWFTEGPDGTILLTWGTIHAASPEHQDLGGRTDATFSVSSDGGKTWSPPAIIEASSAGGPSFNAPFPAIDEECAWHVAYRDMVANELHVATSRDQGGTWQIAKLGPIAWFPTILSHESRLILAYPLPSEAGERPVLRASDDGAATWTEPVVLDEPTAPGQTLFTIDAHPEHGIRGIYVHNKAADASELRAISIGRDLETSDPVVLDAEIGAPGEMLGHYLGLSVGPSGAYAAWTASDGETFDLYGAALR